MKNKPLWIQIWIVIAIITLSISLLLSFILPSTLRSFFTKEIYRTIDSAQTLVFSQLKGDIYRDYIGPDFFRDTDTTLRDIRTVNHFMIYDDNIILNTSLDIAFLQKVKNETISQKSTSSEYTANIGEEKVFYIISKGKALGKDAFLVSYMGDSYREDLVDTLFRRLFVVVFVVLLFSFIPATILSRYISRPLVDLERRVGKLSKNNWTEPVNLNRSDEIGKLGDSVEHLRRQLIRQDEAERNFLQHISHELKTPVMVIRSFAESIKDGIYPKGDLISSVNTIDAEAERLEKKIKNILYLNKLDYMSTHDINREQFSLDGLIIETLERFSLYNTHNKCLKQDLDVNIELESIEINGDIEQWKIVMENLIDNSIRYAREKMSISLEKKDKIRFKIYNDGPQIEDELLGNLFKKFNKGYKGQFGLGLAITHRIVTNHDSSIYARNEDNGVSFYIEIPLKG